MNNRRKSRKLLFVATALMVIGLASVLTVYATVLLGTINGGIVTVGGVATGTISYSTDNSTGWTTPLSVSSGSWYAKLDINQGYAGPVTITWQLYSDASGSWTPVSLATVTTTGIVLSASSPTTVYASSSGAQTNNLDWSTYATGAGAYMVTATINSAS